MLAGRSLAVKLRAPVRRHGVGPIGLDVRLALATVEDVVGRVVDERRAERGDVLRAPDVDGGGFLRVGLGAVDVGPRGRVQHQVRREHRRGGQRDVPVRVAQRHELVLPERLSERAAELAAGARQDDASRSRCDRIGDDVLQRCATRGSFHASAFSSGSDGSYSEVTW